ncbi:nucleocapsid [Botambi virus]|uniref:Nucleoprotein n=1 Tax=Botambi virus TaxID=2849744 RepID=A0AAX3JIU1_9VIRU|nr:nucleocapsid [Botambi virus]WAD86871.1 nucleocapsid [Botambi virus]
MEDIDIAFDDAETVSASTYNPAEQQALFVGQNKKDLTVNNVKIFFIRAAKAKAEMAKKNIPKVRIAFGTLIVDLVNNHRPFAAQSVVQDDDLTLHRLSGYLAKWILDAYKGNAAVRETIITLIVNPISAKMGLNWTHGAELYLSTLPGTEMFLDDFKLYPLAFILIRIKRGEIPETMAKKALRQRYEGKLSAVWMTEEVATVKATMAKVEQIKPVYAGLAATMTRFLQEVGIKI